MKQAQKQIERVERELFEVFLNYLAPISSKLKVTQNRGLEAIVNQKITFTEVKKLQSDISRSSIESAIESATKIENGILRHALQIESESVKTCEESFEIKYDQNNFKERLSLQSNKDGKKLSLEIENENPFNITYGIEIKYERKNNKEVISISYYEQVHNYLAKHIESKDDMSLRVPLKWLNLLPMSQMGGILGFTYLGDHSMGRRDDLTGGMARMVDIHESIHTPDEYETRILTDWIMEKPAIKYKK